MYNRKEMSIAREKKIPESVGGGNGILENQIFIFFLEYFANFDIPKSSKDKYSYSSIYSDQIFLC